MFEEGLFELLVRGGVAVLILGFASVMSVGIIIERVCFLRRYRISDEVLGMLSEALKNKAFMEAVTICNSLKGRISHILKTFVFKLKEGEIDKNRLIEEITHRELLEMRRYMWMLATISSTAPFIGLFGTIIGIMRAFRAIAIHKTGGIEVVGAGIAEALVATAVGLLVAIVATVFYNFLQTKISNKQEYLTFILRQIQEYSPFKGMR